MLDLSYWKQAPRLFRIQNTDELLWEPGCPMDGPQCQPPAKFHLQLDKATCILAVLLSFVTESPTYELLWKPDSHVDGPQGHRQPPASLEAADVQRECEVPYRV
jgi:hypothetical protein